MFSGTGQGTPGGRFFVYHPSTSTDLVEQIGGLLFLTHRVNPYAGRGGERQDRYERREPEQTPVRQAAVSAVSEASAQAGDEEPPLRREREQGLPVLAPVQRFLEFAGLEAQEFHPSVGLPRGFAHP